MVCSARAWRGAALFENLPDELWIFFVALRRSWIGASSATIGSAAQPLHSMQPMPAVVQPS